MHARNRVVVITCTLTTTFGPKLERPEHPPAHASPSTCLFLQHMHPPAHASPSTCLLQHMHPPAQCTLQHTHTLAHASSSTCLLQHTPPPTHAYSSTCILQHMHAPAHASSGTCILPLQLEISLPVNTQKASLERTSVFPSAKLKTPPSCRFSCPGV